MALNLNYTNPANETTAVIVKRFAHSKEKVFQAIVDGHLMLHTGVWPGSLKWDCREGGTYTCIWDLDGVVMQGKGKFTKVSPHDNISFTWHEKDESKSLVEITLETVGNFTKLVIVQSGLTNINLVADVMGGWSDALDGLRDCLELVSLRKSHHYKQSPEKVFEAISKGYLFASCGGVLEKSKIDFTEGGKYEMNLKDGTSFVGQFQRIRSTDLIRCTWNSNGCGETKFESGDTILRIYLTSVVEDGKEQTRLDLFHDGFVDLVAANDHNEGWDCVLKDFEGAF